MSRKLDPAEEKAFAEDWNRLRRIDWDSSPALTIELAKRHLRRWAWNRGAAVALVQALIANARWEESEQIIRRYLRHPRRRVRWNFETLMGHRYNNMGNARMAAKWYRRAIKTARGEFPGLYVFLSGELGKLGDFGGAKSALRRSIALEQKRGTREGADEPLLNLAILSRREGRYREALKYAEKAIKLDPKYREAKVVRRDLLATLEFVKTTHRD